MCIMKKKPTKQPELSKPHLLIVDEVYLKQLKKVNN